RTVSSHEWFERYIHDGYQPFRDTRQGSAVLPGHGQPIQLQEPGHPFAPYLVQRNGYAARFNTALIGYPNVTVLATNRGREPVALELQRGDGSIVFVPPPATPDDERLLREATERI